MYIKTFNIRNFKSFKNITIHFNSDINILTGKNNTGKTTVLEALALWHECFGKLIKKIERTNDKYQNKNNKWTLIDDNNSTFTLQEINSLRMASVADFFYQRNTIEPIELSVLLIRNDEINDEFELGFLLETTGNSLKIKVNKANFDTEKFNLFFDYLPNAISKYYSLPLTNIQTQEDFLTDPQIKEFIVQNRTMPIVKNRLYKLLTFPDIAYINRFYSDFSYIAGFNIELIPKTNIQKDRQVVINFKTSTDDVEKEISLIGSGTVQILELLLNLYQPEETLNNLNLYKQGEKIKDFNIVLIDEPDSHIHREIQQRLITVLSRYSTDNQIFISTHNESLIRSAAHNYLFHLDGKAEAEIKSIDKEDIEKIQPHFKGIYPSQINPIIRSLGNVSGLDFINAMECDRLIFVEGEDDARVINLLLRQQVPPNGKKYMFWVLGGINSALDNINAYKTVFSNIKNTKTLWEKSVFIFDKDDLSIEHKEQFCKELHEKLGLQSYSWNSYTLESVLLTEIDKFAKLLSIWITLKTNLQVDIEQLLQSITTEYQNFKPILEHRFTDKYYEDSYFRYKDLIITKADKVLFKWEQASIATEKKAIPLTDPQLMSYIRQNNQSILQSGEYYKVMSKDHVELLINKVLFTYSISFTIEANFIELIKLVSKQLWFNEWNFLNKI